MQDHLEYIKRAIDLAVKSVTENSGGPFAAIVVKDGEIVGEGMNAVTSKNDPTAHAEVQAIRAACEKLGTFQLEDCIIYSSCEPCPMCLGAIYWARPKALYFAAEKNDASEVGFDDAFIYEEMEKPLYLRSLKSEQLLVHNAKEPFKKWIEISDKIEY